MIVKQERQIKIKFKRNVVLKLTFTLFAVLFWNFIVLSQTPIAESEVKTTANLEIKVPSPLIADKAELLAETSELNSKSTASAERLIHNGDILDVDVLGSLEYDWRGKIDGDGFLSNLPSLNTSILALCRTEQELSRELTIAYSKLARNPMIVVRVIDSSERQPALLFGAVKSPQRFQIQRPAQLNELLIMSGGITEKASGDINIFRPAHASCVEPNREQAESQFIKVKLTDLLSGKTDANLQVRAGDVITVEEAASIYVTGGVAAPQRILFRAGLSVSRAIASAGGFSKEVERRKVFVYRRQKDQVDLKVFELDFDKITNQQAEDVLLEGYDIVDVSQAGRARNARPPVINEFEIKPVDFNKLPLRLIN